MNRRSLFSALLALFLVCPALGDTSPSVNSNAVSNTYTLHGWLREEIDYLTPTNAFSDPRIPSAAAAAASAQIAAEIPQLYTVATNTLTTNLAPFQASIAALRTRPVALMTGAAGLDNILDRQNLTLAVVSNEITHVGNKKHVKAWVAANKLLRSAPIMKARVATLEGDAEWINAEWENYGVSPYRLDFVHPQSYTNFVIATTTNEQTVIITTNVTFEVIEDCVTNTTTKTLTLTNQVLVVMEGAQPRIVIKGDRETLDAYALSFDVPDNVSTNLSVDLSRWIRVGDPERGFDFGNRQLRVNGSKTITTNDCSFLGEFETVGGTSLTNYFNIFIDNGTFKLSERETSND